MLRSMERAPEATFASIDGPVTTAKLFAGGPIVLVFLRHFG
jgi:hypothetical protein